MPRTITKLVTNKLLYVALIIVAGCIAMLLLVTANRTHENSDRTATFGSHTYTLEVADTEAQRVRGLSGRDSLGKYSAMLFVFPEPNEQCMWMKDMKFSLDMVWVNQDKKIAKIAENISPDTYPQAFCGDDTKYVLELNAGAVSQSGLKIGQNLNF